MTFDDKLLELCVENERDLMVSSLTKNNKQKHLDKMKRLIGCRRPEVIEEMEKRKGLR